MEVIFGLKQVKTCAYYKWFRWCQYTRCDSKENKRRGIFLPPELEKRWASLFSDDIHMNRSANSYTKRLVEMTTSFQKTALKGN